MMVGTLKNIFFSVFVFSTIFFSGASFVFGQSAAGDTVFLEGFIETDQTLSPGKVYVVKHNVKIGENATLTVPAGTKVLLDFNNTIVVEGGLNLNGSAGSNVEFSSLNPRSPGEGLIIRGTRGKDINIVNTTFTGVSMPLNFESQWFRQNVRINNSIFTGIFTGEPTIFISSPNSLTDVAKGRTVKFDFTENSYVGNWGSIFIETLQSDVMDMNFSNNLITNNVVYAIQKGNPANALIYGIYDDVESKYTAKISGNSIYGNYQINSAVDTIIREVSIGVQGSGEVFPIPNNYFRSTDPTYISSTLDHFYQNSNLPLLQVEPISPTPGENVPPHIYKVVINGKDIATYSDLPDVDARDATFEVYFNKAVEPFGEHQLESIVYDTTTNELVIAPITTSVETWAAGNTKLTYKVSNASFLNNELGYIILSNYRDRAGREVPDFPIGQQKAVNSYRQTAAGGKTADMMRPGEEKEGADVDIDKGAFLPSKEAVKTLKALTDLGDLSYLGPFESLAKTWEVGLMLGASNYTGSLMDKFTSREHYHIAGGIYGQHNTNKWFSLRAMLWVGQISGNDQITSSLADRSRLINFKNTIVEGSLTLHWHLLKYGMNRGERFTPSLFAGVAIFRNNPMARVFLTLDAKGDPVYLRWNSDTENYATDWKDNTDGYNESEDIWFDLHSIGTEGQRVEDKTDPEALIVDSPFPDRTAPKQYSKVQIGFPMGIEFSWLISKNWNIGGHLGLTWTTSRYLDDVGGYYFDRMNNHMAIVNANPELKAKVGGKKVTLPGDRQITFDDNIIDDSPEVWYPAQLLANPSLIAMDDTKDPQAALENNYAYYFDNELPNTQAVRAEKNFTNYDFYFFGGVKASYIFNRKGEKDRPKEAKVNLEETGEDAFDTDSDGDGIYDSEEQQLGSNPKKADSDGDGISDKEEMERGSDPNSKDSDGDGVADAKDKCPTQAGSKKNDGCPEGTAPAEPEVQPENEEREQVQPNSEPGWDELEEEE